MLLRVTGLYKHFPLRKGWGARPVVRAVDGVSLELSPGDACGLVGESGSGKSTVARLILRLLEPTAGEIVFDGEDISRAGYRQLQKLRSQMQLIFQDPQSALNPRKTIFKSIAEPLIIHTRLRRRALRERVQSLLEVVGLNKEFMFRYPHELSGGQKQRVCIARAVALNPKLLILDEPTSALDVSVQAQTLEFLKELQASFGLTYLFISHNLSVIRIVCNRVAVMYLGKIVEEGETEALFRAPKHPYSQALLSSVPLPQAEQPEIILLEGDIPSPLYVPSGCRFHPRCPQKLGAVCESESPELKTQPDGSRVACHLYP